MALPRRGSATRPGAEVVGVVAQGSAGVRGLPVGVDGVAVAAVGGVRVAHGQESRCGRFARMRCRIILHPGKGRGPSVTARVAAPWAAGSMFRRRRWSACGSAAWEWRRSGGAGMHRVAAGGLRACRACPALCPRAAPRGGAAAGACRFLRGRRGVLCRGGKARGSQRAGQQQGWENLLHVFHCMTRPESRARATLALRFGNQRWLRATNLCGTGRTGSSRDFAPEPMAGRTLPEQMPTLVEQPGTEEIHPDVALVAAAKRRRHKGVREAGAAVRPPDLPRRPAHHAEPRRRRRHHAGRLHEGVRQAGAVPGQQQVLYLADAHRGERKPDAAAQAQDQPHRLHGSGRADRRRVHPARLRGLGPDPEQQYSTAELGDILQQTIAGLSPGFRTVFTLRDIEHLSTEETAERSV